MFFLFISQLDTVDRIVAVVGNRAFWMSEVDEIVLIYGGVMGITPDKLGEFRKAVLEELVNMELLYLKVRQDTTIKVSDQEINQALDQQINILMGKLKKEEFEEKLKEVGLTVDYLREYYRDFVQRNLYIQKFVEMKVKPNIKVSNEEVMNFYKTYKDSLKQPDEYKIAVISFIVKPSAREEQEYYRRAKNIYERLKKGEDFSSLAVRMSDDRESAQNGGNLGVIPKNALPPDFINEIEKTPVGGITKPLRGPQGYHIFKVLGKQDDSYLLAHILVKVKPSQKAKDNVMARAKRVANLAKAGQDFSKLARTYSEDPISRENGGDIGWVSEVVLPKNLAESLRNAKVGDIVGPIESPDGLTINIFKVLDKREGREPTYEEIRNVVLGRKIDEQLKKLIEDAKKEFYYKINL
jgi:peptidyl-prolyl cis-trans isomerase SurA